MRGDESLPVCFQEYSDYSPLVAKDIGVFDLYDNGGYPSCAYSKKAQGLLRPWLVFPGN